MVCAPLGALIALLLAVECHALQEHPHQRLIKRASKLLPDNRRAAAAAAATTTTASKDAAKGVAGIANPTTKAVAATTTAANPDFTALTRLRYAWPFKGPNHIDTDPTGVRGPQQGGASKRERAS